MILRKILVVVLIICGQIVSAQKRCGMEEYTEGQGTQTARVAAGEEDSVTEVYPVPEIIKIPVVVHVIHNNAHGQIGGTNISDEQIYSQIRVLNEDFRKMSGTKGFNNDPAGADVQIEFCLATKDPNGNDHSGINRVYHSNVYWTVAQGNEMKSLSYWPSDQYLNIWVANIMNVLGYSQFPEIPSLPGLEPPYTAETDGVAIDYTNFGTVGSAEAPYNFGRTATHEIGHWMGLLHIWGKGTCGEDYIEDTPKDAGSTKKSVCADSSNCLGFYTKDMVNNYMDYTDDACMDIFTLGQKERMRSVFKLNGRRNALIGSHGCSPVNGIAGIDSKDILMFPNPADDIVNFRLPATLSGKIIIADEMNRQVTETIFENLKEPVVNISALSPGFYFITIETANKTYQSKLIRI
jgi:hypothetical protein